MSDSPAAPPAPKPAQAETPDKAAFGRAFWMLNSIEMFERLAYYGIRVVAPIYIMQAAEPGGLHLTASHKGWIYAWWAAFQSLLPIFTGGYADRFGYKRMLGFSVLMNIVGYLMMAYLHSYEGFFAGILVLATGTAFFKPALQGALAQKLEKGNASVGWGIFYWVVNIGAFMAPFFTTAWLGNPHSADGWRMLFLASAGYTALNLLLLLTFRDVPSGAPKDQSIFQVLWRTIVNILDIRLIAWLLIMSCFWLMMYQLWDLQPNFVEDWVDSAHIAQYMPDAWREYGDRGLVRVPQQILLNLNALLIILLVLPVSWLVARMRTLSAMLIGMSVATIGILVAGLTGNATFLLLGVVFFSLGEMLTGPKKNQYLGLIAPPGKKGIYLGYVNIPVGIGVFVGSWIAGEVYGQYGEKATLALKELAAQPKLLGEAAQSIDWSDALGKLPPLLELKREDALAVAAREMGVEPDVAATTLRSAFRLDWGQVTNLGLIHLANMPPYDAIVRPKLDGARPAERVDKLASWMDVPRGEVFALLRESASFDGQPAKAMSDNDLIAALWAAHGDEPAVLDNLALEYLAQGTDLVRQAAAHTQIADPIQDIPAKIGITRTKAFAALCGALGRSPEEISTFLERGPFSDIASPELRIYAYLATLDHVRFRAVAKINWPRNVGVLRELIEASEPAKQIATERLANPSLMTRVGEFFTNLFGGGNADAGFYERLAERLDIIQEAFAVKDWCATPEQARLVLRLNPYEARARAGAEMAGAGNTATATLWREYNPQYHVWLPFAAIGVVATIALAIFGQMAKRWKDMNA